MQMMLASRKILLFPTSNSVQLWTCRTCKCASQNPFVTPKGKGSVTPQRMETGRVEKKCSPSPFQWTLSQKPCNWDRPAAAVVFIVSRQQSG